MKDPNSLENNTDRVRSKLNSLFTSRVTIFGQNLLRKTWLLIFMGSCLTLAFITFLAFFVLSSLYIRFEPIIFFGIFSIFGLLLIYLGVRLFFINIQGFIVFVLILSTAAFVVEDIFLNSEIFPEFTLRTVVLLYVTFSTLFISIFYKKIPSGILIPIPAILITGVILCIPFIIAMGPMMLFGWIAIPFLGLGLLPYSPLLASTAFAITAYKIDKHIQIEKQGQSVVTRGLSIFVLCCIFAYSAWFFYKWHGIHTTVKNQTEANSGHNRLDKDLPTWARLGMQLDDNHVTEFYLMSQRTSRRAFSISNSIFDPLAFPAELIFEKSVFIHGEQEHLLKLIFGKHHVGLKRLWSGLGLSTTNVNTHVQLFPDSHVAYTETTLSIYNESNRTREAIYTITMPPGSTATKLSLWIDGKEESARLTLKSKARKAYRTIVGVERRDPALLEWMDSSRLRLRVFPVSPNNFRTVKFGIVSPMKKNSKKLTFNSLKIEGPSIKNARHRLNIDLFSDNRNSGTQTENQKTIIEAENIKLKEKLVSDGQVRQWNSNSSYREDWKVSIDSPVEITGKFKLNREVYSAGPIEYSHIQFKPQIIVIALNKGISKEKWENIYSKIEKSISSESQIILAGTEWFSSKDQSKMIRFIRESPLPGFNLFPFYMLPPNKTVLIVSAGGKMSVPLSETKGSKFHKKTNKFFSKNNRKIFAISINGRLSSYINGLAEFHRIEVISITGKELVTALQMKSVSTPRKGKNSFLFLSADMSIQKKVTTQIKGYKSSKGGDLLARLYFYNRIMSETGRRQFQHDSDKSDLIKIAADGAIVSPVSSLVVLESERDYNRFGIKKKPSKLGQSKLSKPGKTPGLGLVPEPEEWAFFTLIVLIMMYRYRQYLVRMPGLSWIYVAFRRNA